MPNEIASLLSRALEARGWDIRTEEELKTAKLTFDFVAESDFAVVFCKVLPGTELSESVPGLVAQVAAITQRFRNSSKAWEAYLLLPVLSNRVELFDVAQQIQYDLSYCRKVVLDGEVLIGSANPEEEANRALAFLFPMHIASEEAPLNVKDALIEHLVSGGTSRELASELVTNFDESDCRCEDRVLEVP